MLCLDSITPFLGRYISIVRFAKNSNGIFLTTIISLIKICNASFRQGYSQRQAHETTPESPSPSRQAARNPPDVRASLQARASRPSTASGHSLVPPLPRSNALLRRHAPKPETAHHHGHCPTSVWPCPHPPVLISCRQAHRRSPLVPDLDHTSVLHHLRSDIYETLSLLLHEIRQLVDKEVPSCVTSLSSSVCTPFRRWPGSPECPGSPTSRSKCYAMSADKEEKDIQWKNSKK